MTTTMNAIDLLPHKDSMLLLDEVISVSDSQAQARVRITPNSSFYLPNLGVPACIGLEYMGQTAALIAGLSQMQGTQEPQIGFLLGSRLFQQTTDYFTAEQNLVITATAGTIVGNQLANFNCVIADQQNQTVLCEGTLSVMRKPIMEQR